jgi:hypothetical protein
MQDSQNWDEPNCLSTDTPTRECGWLAKESVLAQAARTITED